jgi:hypothetical protein
VQRLRISEAVVLASFDQDVNGQAAVAHEFFGVGVRNHIICPAVEDRGVGPNGLRRAVLPPRRAEKHEGSFPSLEVHCDCASTAAAYDHIGLMLVELGLSDGESGVEVVIGQGGVDDGVAVIFQERRLDAAWNGLPTVKEEDEHLEYYSMSDSKIESIVRTAGG